MLRSIDAAHEIGALHVLAAALTIVVAVIHVNAAALTVSTVSMSACICITAFVHLRAVFVIRVQGACHICNPWYYKTRR